MLESPFDNARIYVCTTNSVLIEQFSNFSLDLLFAFARVPGVVMDLCKVCSVVQDSVLTRYNTILEATFSSLLCLFTVQIFRAEKKWMRVG